VPEKAQGTNFPGGLIIRDRLVISVAVVLLSAAGVSWAATYYLMPPAAGTAAMGVNSVITSLSPVALASFELVWLVGMAAMMFPAMLPVVLFYDRIVAKSEADPRRARVVGTPLFLLGYLVAYGGLGLVSYVVLFAVLQVAAGGAWIAPLAFAGPTVVLFIAGLYQLSGTKTKALAVCVSPVGFFSTQLRRGLLGSLRMGWSHGLYCVACCWAYMLVMLAVAVMSLPFMAIVAALVTLEKVVVKGAKWFRWGVAGAFMLLGVVVLLLPGFLALL
jgi:predicted metal-binding membrane protein